MTDSKGDAAVADLRDFFFPRRIAVIGASEDVGRIRGRFIVLLRQHGFQGEIIPVTPSHDTVQGLPAVARIDAIEGDPVDLALVAVPAPAVVDVLRECAAAGVRGAIVFTSGFAEEGGKMAEAQAEITRIARTSGMRIGGPNAMGYFNARGRVAATFSQAIDTEEAARGLDAGDLPGGVAIVSQSGGLGFSIYNRALRRRIGGEFVVGTGNEADLATLDFAEFLLEDPGVRQLLLFLEGVRDGSRLAPFAARAAELGKPVIVAKVGRSPAAQRAAISHTASLTGSDSAFDALFARYGMLRVNEVDHMLDLAAAFAMPVLPAGDRVAVVTASGGSGSWLADGLAAVGLQVPELDAETQQRVLARLPSYGSAGNPVDVTAQAMAAINDVLDEVVASDAIDMVVLVSPLSLVKRNPYDLERIRSAIARSGKPVVFYSYTPPSDVMRDFAARAGCAVYGTIDGCARGLRALVDWVRFRERHAAQEDLGARVAAMREAIAPVLARHPAGGVLTEHDSRELLAAAGIGGPVGSLATTEAEALAAFEAIGGPVALKLQSTGLPHKTDAGAIRLGVADADGVRRAFRELELIGPRVAAGAPVQGVLVQAMAAPGVEMIAGIVRDADLGPLLMVGAGGIHAEVLRDTAFTPAPADAAEVRRLLDGLRLRPLLDGVRGAPPADIDAFVDLACRLSLLGAAADRIDEVEVNPVFVHPAGTAPAGSTGALAIDALVRLRASGE